MGRSQEILSELLKYLKISANKLAAEIGLNANTAIYHVKNGRNNISPDLANKITERYSEIDYNWLLTGEGEMLKSQKGQNERTFSSIAKEEDVDYGDLRSMHRDLKRDLAAISEGMTRNFEVVSEGVMKGLKDQQKVLDFIKKLDAKEISRASKGLNEFLQEKED